MNCAPSQFDELADLVWALANDRLDAEGESTLHRMLESDAANRRIYIELIDQFALLEWEGAERHAEELKGEDWESVPHPTLSTTHYPLYATFVGGPVFSYMVATVVLCLMLLGAWAYKITHDRNTYVNNNSRRSTTSGQPEIVFVGRITGMNDCRWSNTDTQTVIGASVPLDREYALSSGLLEITYKSGARVILEGPCTYRVESSAGGFLERGKLTARVETKSEVGGRKSEERVHNTSAFVVKTPTTIVTDLGTEFGVEVAENGDTISYVFEGKVVVKATGGTGSASDASKKLNAGESVMVSRVRETHLDSTTTEMVRFTHPTTPPKFVRRMPQFDPHAYAEAVLADNPVAYWRLNETGGDGTEIRDSADAPGMPQQGRQNGVFTKTDSFAGLGYAGPSVAFRGFETDNKSSRFWGTLIRPYSPETFCSFINVGNPPALRITGRLTLEAWVFVEEYGNTYHSGVIAKYCGESAPDVAADLRSYNLLITRDGKPAFYISSDGTRADELHVSSNGTRDNVAHVLSATTVPLNRWTYLAAVYVPGESMKLYRGGKLDAELTRNVPSHIFDSAADVWIGIQHVLQWNNNFKGRIDEAAIYDTALGAARIAAHYAAARGKEKESEVPVPRTGTRVFRRSASGSD